MASIESEIKQLRAELERLEARVAEGAADDCAADDCEPASKPDGDAVLDTEARESRPGRRQLLTKVAGGAAAAVVGGAALAVGQASPAAAAAGNFDGNPAVLGTGTGADAIGVKGVGNGNWGVYGEGQSGTAGVSTGGVNTWGLQGVSPNGIGAAGESTLGVGVASSVGLEGVHLRLAGGTKPPLSANNNRLQGDIARDTNGDLWLCVESASGMKPRGVWRRVSGTNTAGSLTPLLTPVRVYDSRPGQLPATTPKNPLAANSPRVLDLKNNGSRVPAGATAALVSLVATGTTTAIGGFMTIYRNGIVFPGTSNLNWSGPSQTVAVTTLTAVDAQARVNVYAGSVTDVVLDVLGYYL